MMKTKKFVLKDTTEQQETQTEPIEEPSVNFTTNAFSIVNLDGKWFVAEIPLDPKTQETGEWKLIQEDGSKNAAIERFKINVQEKLIQS